MSDQHPGQDIALAQSDFRSLCAELLAELENAIRVIYREDGTRHVSSADPVITKADVALAQPVPPGPTDEELEEEFGRALLKLSGDSMNATAVVFARTVLARWGNTTLQPVPARKMADVHYEWELEDASGNWQAGGSANSLDDVEREGLRYLHTYAQDGPNKLIIRQHCAETINEISAEDNQ